LIHNHLVCVKDSTSTLFVSGYNSAWGCNLIYAGTHEIIFENNFLISPNPSTGIFTLSSSQNISSIEISDVLGNQVFKSQVTSHKEEIDLSSHPKGIYFVKVMDKKGNFGVKKIILQ
jgi:hypothetical protein